MNFDIDKLQWTCEPNDYLITEDTIRITTAPVSNLMKSKNENRR